jgi:hypothetical protein
MGFHLFHILIKIYLAYKVKVGFKKRFTNQFSNLLVTYFYYIKVLQILYSTYHKPNVGIDVFKIKIKNFPIYFLVFL